VSASDIVALLALLVSALSFAVAAITGYEQYSKKPRLSAVIGDNIYLSYGENKGDLGIIIAVSLLNSGASDALVLRMEGHLTGKAGKWTAPIIWNCFMQPQSVGSVDTSVKVWWAFGGWVSPLIASSRKASTNWIFFSVFPLQSTLSPGSYQLNLRLLIGPGERLAAQWSGSFSLGEDDAEFLEKYCVVTSGNVNKESLRLTLDQKVSRGDVERTPHFVSQPSEGEAESVR
jgi:hypothetical protein